MMADVEKFHFRLVLLGSLGTGFLFKKFEPKYKPTVEDLFTQDFDLGSIEIKVDFLDTSGSMQFPAMRRLSITTGSAFLIVYAVDDETSYDVLKMCIAEIQEIRPDYQEIPIVFAGNKCDIPREKRTVLKEVVSNYVHYELPRLRAKVIECSCKNGINIDNIFKAYLSLAKVSLSAAVSAGLKGQQESPNSPITNPNGGSRSTAASANEQPETSAAKVTATHGRRPSSLKVVLGVRKSCDAAIISPMRNIFVSAPSNERTPIGSQTCSPAGSDQRIESSGVSGSSRQHTVTPSGGQASLQRAAEGEQSNLNRLGEMNLETAIQSKLNLANSAKPRSRSLIWRPNRKSRLHMDQTSNCRTS